MRDRSRFSLKVVSVALPLSASITLALISRAGDEHVAKVGNRTISVSEVNERARRVPAFQLQSLGSTPAEIRRRLIDQMLDQELFAQGALADGLDQQPDVQDRIRAVLRSAMMESLRREAKAADISDAEILAYYTKNKDRYTSRERLKLWQIVLESEQKAKQLLATIRDDPAYQKDPVGEWEKLARQHSLDKSTAMRKGSLGFVEQDGSTAHTDVKVNPALFAAAAKVKDGEVVPAPVKDGKLWVVLQRRGSHKTPARSLGSEREAIRGILLKQRMLQDGKKLIEQLRRQYKVESYADRVDVLQVDSRGELSTPERPGGLPQESHPAAGKGRPEGLPGYFR